MLYFVFTKGPERDWHVGEPNPVFPIEVNQITEVQADSEELAYVRTRFWNLPNSNTSSVTRWFGDHAKFIAANL